MYIGKININEAQMDQGNLLKILEFNDKSRLRTKKKVKIKKRYL